MAANGAEGWTYLFNSPKWHYFRGGRSLCSRFMLLGSPKLETEDTPSPDNCKKCWEKRQREVRDAD